MWCHIPTLEAAARPVKQATPASLARVNASEPPRTRPAQSASARTPAARPGTSTARPTASSLYVVDTSSFPSIGAVNLSLTAIASALRVGDRIIERIQ